MKLAGRFALGLGAVNFVTLLLMAAVSAKDGMWGSEAQSLPAGAMPVSEVARRAEDAGVHRIHRIEADGTSYRVQGLDDGGRRLELHVDPLNGTVTR